MSLILTEGHANYFEMGHSAGYAIFIIHFSNLSPVLSKPVLGGCAE
jgi:hypothetical protein